MGTWQASPSDGFWKDQDPAASEKTLRYALKHGIGTFDCAQSYGHGRAEQLLGKLSSSNSFLVDTKIMPTVKPVRDLVNLSLSRLKVPFINRLYIHWPSSRIDWRANLKEMQALKDEGLVRKIGVCNLTFEELKHLYKEIPIACFQRPVSLIWSHEYDETRLFCTDNGIELAAYSPLGTGILSSNPIPKDDPRASLFCFDLACRDILNEIKNSCTVRDALLWVKAKKPDVLLLGARSVEQLEQNLAILTETQAPEKTAQLDGLASRLSAASRQICDNIFSYRW